MLSHGSSRKFYLLHEFLLVRADASRLYNTKVFSDVTINFGDLDEIRAHKSILSIGSAWFHARFIAVTCLFPSSL